MHGYMTIKQLSKRLGIDPATVRRMIEKTKDSLGLAVTQIRTSTSNAKSAHGLPIDQAERLIAYYEGSRPGATSPVSVEAAPEDSLQRFGVFYLIQLIPEVLPNRVKVGYTDNLQKRLGEHQTAAPTAKVLASWPCKRSWDYAAMDSITRTDCEYVLNEVYEGDIDGFIHRGNDFFSRMPKPDQEKRLSRHSPLVAATGTPDIAEHSGSSPATDEAIVDAVQSLETPQDNR